MLEFGLAMTEKDLKIYAPVISTYGRIAAMTAEEVGLAWENVPTHGEAAGHRARHPFQKTPAVEIDGHSLFETIAICQYVDDVYGGGGLQPTDPLDRARMTQWVSIANAYIFPTTENGLILPRLVVPMMGGQPREELIEQALPTIAYQMTLVSSRLEEAPYLAGNGFSLADIFMYCILRAVQLTPEGRMIFDQLLPLKKWIGVVSTRASAKATAWTTEDSINELDLPAPPSQPPPG